MCIFYFNFPSVLCWPRTPKLSRHLTSKMIPSPETKTVVTLLGCTCMAYCCYYMYSRHARKRGSNMASRVQELRVQLPDEYGELLVSVMPSDLFACERIFRVSVVGVCLHFSSWLGVCISLRCHGFQYELRSYVVQAQFGGYFIEFHWISFTIILAKGWFCSQYHGYHRRRRWNEMYGCSVISDVQIACEYIHQSLMFCTSSSRNEFLEGPPLQRISSLLEFILTIISGQWYRWIANGVHATVIGDQLHSSVWLSPCCEIFSNNTQCMHDHVYTKHSLCGFP